MPYSVLVALGSNLGDRALSLRRAIDALRNVIRVVRVSPFVDTDPVDAPPGSPRFLNAVVAGYTDLDPQSLLSALLAIETRLGRRRTTRNAPRVIDIDSHPAQRASRPHARADVAASALPRTRVRARAVTHVGAFLERSGDGRNH